MEQDRLNVLTINYPSASPMPAMPARRGVYPIGCLAYEKSNESKRETESTASILLEVCLTSKCNHD